MARNSMIAVLGISEIIAKTLDRELLQGSTLTKISTSQAEQDAQSITSPEFLY